MFQTSAKLDIAEPLFTGLYVVVCKTEGTRDELYRSVVEFLNSNLGGTNTLKLLGNFLKKSETEVLNRTLNYEAKVRMGPTQLLWNADQESATSVDDLFNRGKCRELLRGKDYVKHLGQGSKVELKYVEEEKFKNSYIPNLFYKGKVIATIIVHDDDEMDYQSLIDFFYEKKNTYEEKHKVKFQFLVSRSKREFTETMAEQFDKYIVKEDLYKYRKWNQFTENEEMIYDAMFFLDEPELVYDSLGDLVGALLINFLTQLVKVMDNPKYSIENVRKAVSHNLGSSKSKKLEYTGETLRNYADIYLMFQNYSLAIPFYIAANHYFGCENDHLKNARSHFSLAITMCKRFQYAEFMRVPHKEESEEKGGEIQEGASQSSSTFEVESSSSSSSSNDLETQSEHKKSKEKRHFSRSLNEIVPREFYSRPKEYLMYYLKRAFALWLKTFDNSEDLLLLFVFYTNVLFRVRHTLIPRVVGAFVVYAEKAWSLEQQRNILNYASDLTEKTRFKRKAKFYRFLLRQKELEWESTFAKGGNESEKYPKEEDKRYFEVHKGIRGLFVGSNSPEVSRVMSSCEEYQGWYKIKKAIVNKEIAGLETALSHKESQKLVMYNMANMFQYMSELTETVKVKVVQEEINEFIKSTKNREMNRYRILHLVITKPLMNKTRKSLNKEQGYCSIREQMSHLKQEEHEASYIGGSENVKFKKFPIAYSIAVSGHDFNYRYTKSNLKVVDQVVNNKKGASEYIIVMKKRYPYKGYCKCNYKKLYKNNKWIYSISINSNRTQTSTTSWAGSSIQGPELNTARDEAKCVVTHEKKTGNMSCKIKKTQQFKKFVSSRKNLTKITNWMEEESESKGEERGETRVTQYIYDDLTEEKVVYVGKILNMEVMFNNPLPIALHVTNIQLTGRGAKFDSVPTEVVIPAFARKYKHNLNILVKEAGRVYITGIKFRLFESLNCYQLLLDGSKEGLEEILKCFQIEKLNLSEDDWFNYLRDFSVVDLQAVQDYNKSSLQVYFTDFSESTEVNTNGEGSVYASRVSGSRLTSITNQTSGRDKNSQRSGLQSYRSSVTGTNAETVRTTFEDWNGLRIPNFGFGTVSKELKRCEDLLCNWCRVFDHFCNHFSESLTIPKLVNGEKKLLFIRLDNQNKNHAFVNIKLTVLPTNYTSDKKTVAPLTTAKDMAREKVIKSKIENMKNEIYSRYMIILNHQCVVLSSDSLRENKVDEVEEQGERDLILKPNESLYVPIVYRANEVLRNFNVIFDYEIVEVEFLKRYQEMDLIRGNVHKQVKIEVDRGLKITDFQFEKSIEFNEKFFIHNILKFKTILSKSTIEKLQRYKNMFDQQSVKLFLKVTNDTKDTFSCNINRKNKFISSSGTSTRWFFKIRRMNHEKMRYTEPWEFTKNITCKLEMKWACYPDRMGSINLYDVNASDLTQEKLRRYVESNEGNCAIGEKSKFNPLRGGRDKRSIDYLKGSRMSSSGYYTKSLVWKMNNIHRVPKWYWTNIQGLIHQNIHNLVMSKLSIKISVSLEEEEKGSTKKIYRIESGSMFKVTVLVVNKGRETIEDYRVLVLPYNNECYTTVYGLEWTGSLDKIGNEPILPSTLVKPPIRKSGEGRLQVDFQDGEHEYYTNVAEVTFLATQPATLVINAAVIVDRESTIYWHHNPAIFFVH